MAEVISSDQVAEQAKMDVADDASKLMPPIDAAPADEKPLQNGDEPVNLLNAKGNGEVEATAESAEDATTKGAVDAGSDGAGAKGDSKDADDKEADEGDGSDESSSDEELVGEFDNPMGIIEGKRNRKSTSRLEDVKPLNTNKELEEMRKQEPTYEGGKGVKFSDIAYVNKELRGEPQYDLLPLHKLCYGPRFDPKRARHNLLEFSGFNFDKDDAEFKKRETFLQRFNKEGLKYICGLLGVDVMKREDLTTEVNGVSTTTSKMVVMSAEELRVVLATFLLKPHNTGLTPNAPVPAVREPKPKTPQQKKPATEAGSAEPKKRRRSKKKSIEAEVEVVKSPKKNEPTQVRIGVPKKKRASDAAPKDDNDSEDDDAPLSKKKKNEPTNDEVRTIIEQFLDGADLNLVTMKIVCRHVFDTYAPMDLVSRKDFIKTTVKDIIQSS